MSPLQFFETAIVQAYFYQFVLLTKSLICSSVLLLAEQVPVLPRLLNLALTRVLAGVMLYGR
jgi:hypothetical protein